MDIQTFTSETDFIKANLDFLKSAKAIALSGGSTPGPTYKVMGSIPRDNSQNTPQYYQVDERYVPADHPDSNQKMIAETLAQPIHHFDTSLSIEEALHKYEDEIANIKFDICILGIGPDGHTASLFPESPALKATRSVAHTQTDEFAVQDRLTITFPKILESKKILILLKNKEDILAKLETSTNLPSQKITEHPHLKIHHLQTEATPA